MTAVQKKQLIIKILMAGVPFLIFAGIVMFPGLVVTGPEPERIYFNVEEQTETSLGLLLRGSFSREIPANENMWIYAEDAEVELTVNERTVGFNGREGTPDLFQSPGSSWYCVVSSGIEAGQEAEFLVRSYYGMHEEAASQMCGMLYMGDGSGLYRLMFQRLDAFGLILICALVAGIIYMVEGAVNIAVGMPNEGMRIILFGFYCFSGGVGCVTSGLYPFLSLLLRPSWLVSVLEASGLLLFPLAAALLMRYYTRGRWTRRIMTAVSALETAIIAIGILLQLTRTMDLTLQRNAIGIAALITIIISVICIGRDLLHYRDRSLLLLLLTLLPIFINGVLDGVNLIRPFREQRSLGRYSFAISVLILMFQLAGYAGTQLKNVRSLQVMESELADSRISIMLSQIQPHFLFNSLLSIKQLCDTEPGKASVALEHFACYMRANLYSISSVRLVLFEKELELVRNYLYLEKLRFTSRLNIEWDIQSTGFLIPPLTLQPVAENAVRHGITRKREGGTLTIRTQETELGYVITVADDGVGYDMAAPADNSRPHIGIKNVRKRLEAQCGGSLYIVSEPGKGTQTTIVLPRHIRDGVN